MRKFVDERGWRWDVIVGRESWGSLYALFIPGAGVTAQPRQALLDAVSLQAANEAIDTMHMQELRRLFERSEPKETG